MASADRAPPQHQPHARSGTATAAEPGRVWMSSAGLECRCAPAGCRCAVTVPHGLLNCCFPCLLLLTKLTVKAREQALNRTDTMGQAKTKRIALLSMLFFVASEVIDCGSDVVVYVHTVRPQAAIIDAEISTGFVPAYLILLVLSLLVSSVVLLARVGFVYCIAHKRGKVEKEEEYLLITLNELCGLFVLVFEDTPFIVLNCILIYNAHNILGCGGEAGGSAAGTVAAAAVECDQDEANRRLRELMISFSISAVCVSLPLRCPLARLSRLPLPR